MPQTDAAAVALARDGDSEAFRALVERHGRAVYHPELKQNIVQQLSLMKSKAATDYMLELLNK